MEKSVTWAEGDTLFSCLIDFLFLPVFWQFFSFLCILASLDNFTSSIQLDYFCPRSSSCFLVLPIKTISLKPNKSHAATHEPGSRRSAGVRLNSPAAAGAAAEIQGAVVEKGIEVMGKMVDKQLQIIDEAQQKAENFLKKKVR